MDDSQTGSIEAYSPKQEPVQENLKRRKKQFQDKIADIDSALVLLESNPQVLDILNVLRRVGV